jgi:hypothetical protein
MPISAGGGLFASAPQGTADPPAVSDGTRVAGNAISVAASARLSSLSSPGIHSDASSARSVHARMLWILASVACVSTVRLRQ